ncbi:MAG: PilZ domain-containing protein, partial [Pseudohongiella sp.]|nr:PilZ domain-containing protein [Pseudohongiella sp.]
MMSESTGNSAEHQSRRAFTRIFFDAETVVIQGEHIWPVQLVDISLRGVLIRILPDQFLRDSEQLDVS